MNLDQFIEKYKGKGVDYDHFYSTQCVDLIRQYIKEVLNQPQPRGVVGAKDFWTNYESDPNLNQYFNKIPKTQEGIPSKGDIIVWGSTYGKFGHIAIINWANVNQFQALSQNDPIGSLTILKNYSYNHILGWFSPKGNMDYQKMYDEARKDRDSWWNAGVKIINEILGAVTIGNDANKTDYMPKRIDESIAKYHRVVKERNDARSERDNYAEEIKAKDIQIELLKKDISALNSDLEDCQNQVPENEDLEKDYEASGRKIIRKIGDTIIETSYKRKE